MLVPGIIGSGLQAEIDKNYKVAWECFKKWRTPWGIWVNLYEGEIAVYFVARFVLIVHSFGTNVLV